MNTLDSQLLWDTLITATYGKVYWFAYRTVSHWCAADLDAEDIVQTAYERLYRRLQSDASLAEKIPLDVEGATRYLKRMVHNLVFEFARNLRYFVGNISIDDEGIGELTDPSASTEDIVLGDESATRLLTQIKALTSLQQAVIGLRFEGLSPNDIATRLSLSSGAVRSALFRAKHTVRKLLEEAEQHGSSQSLQKVSHADIGRQAILSSIQELRDPYRTVMAFRMVHGMSYKDMAETLHRSVGTLKSQYHRGKKLLAREQKNAARKKDTKKKTAIIQAMRVNGDQLPDHWRQPIELYYLHALSYKEIARRLGRSEGTVKSWIKRATDYLQQCTPDACRFPPSHGRKHALPVNRPIDECIPRVSKPYRPAFILYYKESWRIIDIAKRLDQSESTVKMHLSRGRAQVIADTAQVNP